MSNVLPWCLLTYSVFSAIIQKDRNALIDIYVGTNGTNWNQTWNEEVLKNGTICPDYLYGIYCDASNTQIIEIDLYDNNLQGTIPPSIGNLTSLTMIYLSSNKLSGTLPSSIGNLTLLTDLHLGSNQLSGNIPPSIGNLISLQSLWLCSNQFRGNIPSSIGKLISLGWLALYSNQLNGTIPSSIGNLTSLIALYLSSNQISGTIPSSIASLTYLQYLFLSSNQLNGTIPSSIGNLTSLIYLFLYSNQLSGTIPSSIRNFTSLQYLFLSNNSLSGPIPSTFTDMVHLRNINLDNNHLSFNIIDFLNILWKNKLNLTNVIPISGISFFNNPNIFGDFNTLNLNASKLQYFMGHNCNLYGYINDNITFPELQYFSLSNNRLSGTIPKKLLNNVIHVNKTLILSSNLFSISNNPPNWLSTSRFLSAKSLYITNNDEIISYILIAASLCFILFILIQNLIYIMAMFNKQKNIQTADKRKAASADNVNIELFFMRIQSIITTFNKLPNILLSLILIAVYYYNSNYFMYSLITDNITVSYYDSHHIYWNIIIVLLWSAFFIFIAYSITKIQYKQKTKYNNNYNNGNAKNNIINNATTTILKLLYFLIYLLLFLIGNALVVLSIFFDTLPADGNIFKINKYEIEFISKSVGFILAMNTAIIIPKFVDATYNLFFHSIYIAINSSNYISTYRPIVILLFRSCSIIIIPFISSMYISENCGNRWALFWTDCSKPEYKDKYFNITETFYESVAVLDVNLLSPNDVCGPKTIDDINWDKCLRFYSSRWSSVLITKLISMMFLPFITILFKTAKHKLLSSKYKIFNRFQRFSSNDITVDMQYAMILTKCETMIIYGIISPIIIPLTIISMQINYYSYIWIIRHQKWSIKPFNKNINIPTPMLWISFIVSQFFICLFSFISIKDKFTSYILLSMILFINTIIVLRNIKQKLQNRLKYKYGNNISFRGNNLNDELKLDNSIQEK